jgi:hypothetical protein
VGPESPPGKGGNHPEASIGESSEMAASSVCSEYKSRVIEPRNIGSVALPSNRPKDDLNKHHSL